MAGGRLRWQEAGWGGKNGLRWQQALARGHCAGHRDTPDIPTCCTSRPRHPRGRQGDIWEPRGPASPTGSLVPVVPSGCGGCGATVPAGWGLRDAGQGGPRGLCSCCRALCSSGL